MQPDIDAQLSNFFEETPQRDFARVMRGYDPHQVNEHLKQIDGELRQHRDQVQALHRELAEAHRQIQEQERPTYSGLGSRIEQLLRLAEEQATEILQEARTAANEFNATAKVVPLSKTMKEQVDHIRKWAFDRAVRASPRERQ